MIWYRYYSVVGIMRNVVYGDVWKLVICIVGECCCYNVDIGVWVVKISVLVCVNVSRFVMI